MRHRRILVRQKIILQSKASFRRGLVFYFKGLKFFSLKAFSTTETELKLIANAANIGVSKGPPKA